MTTIYIPMEPQPEIEILEADTLFFDEGTYEVFIKTKEFIKAPYKPGDEIEWVHKCAPFPTKKGIVKSIHPVQRVGVWVWEIECE